jgi:hypothetical protein
MLLGADAPPVEVNPNPDPLISLPVHHIALVNYGVHPSSRGICQLVGAGFKPALLTARPLARYSLDHPPTAQDCARCKREREPTPSRCE